MTKLQKILEARAAEAKESQRLSSEAEKRLTTVYKQASQLAAEHNVQRIAAPYLNIGCVGMDIVGTYRNTLGKWIDFKLQWISDGTIISSGIAHIDNQIANLLEDLLTEEPDGSAAEIRSE